MGQSWAILAGAALIAGSIAFVSRWEIGVADGGFTLRLDRWTGEIVTCKPTPDAISGAMQTGAGYSLACPAAP